MLEIRNFTTNKIDEKFLQKAKELNLTAQVAIKLDDAAGKVYKFNIWFAFGCRIC